MNKLANQTEQFLQHLESRAYKKGWEVRLKSDHVRFRCPHGKIHKDAFYPEEFKTFPSTKGIADQYFRRAMQFCQGNHEDQKFLAVWPTLKTPVLSVPEPYYIALGVADMIPTTTFSSTWTLTTPISSGITTWYGAGRHPVLSHLSKACPALDTARTECPLDHCSFTATLGTMIPHINDNHQWPRNQIADWLETLDLDLTIQKVKEKEKDAEPTWDLIKTKRLNGLSPQGRAKRGTPTPEALASLRSD